MVDIIDAARYIVYFSEDFSLWETGPVSQRVHDLFSKYGRDEIPAHESACRLVDKNIKETIDAVWEYYRRKSAYDTVRLVKTRILNT